MTNTNHNKKMSYDVTEGDSWQELRNTINNDPAVRSFFLANKSEKKLRQHLAQIPGVTEVCNIADSDPTKADMRFKYLDMPMTIEVKSLGTDSIKEDILTNSWQGTVAIKNTDKRTYTIDGLEQSSTHLERGQFDILAINCFAVRGKWEFQFMDNEYIPAKSAVTPNLLKTKFVVNPKTTPLLVEDLATMIQLVYLKKQSGTVKI
jgi:hypothetical protein